MSDYDEFKQMLDKARSEMVTPEARVTEFSLAQPWMMKGDEVRIAVGDEKLRRYRVTDVLPGRETRVIIEPLDEP